MNTLTQPGQIKCGDHYQKRKPPSQNTDTRSMRTARLSP